MSACEHQHTSPGGWFPAGEVFPRCECGGEGPSMDAEHNGRLRSSLELCRGRHANTDGQWSQWTEVSARLQSFREGGICLPHPLIVSPGKNPRRAVRLDTGFPYLFPPPPLPPPIK